MHEIFEENGIERSQLVAGSEMDERKWREVHYTRTVWSGREIDVRGVDTLIKGIMQKTIQYNGAFISTTQELDEHYMERLQSGLDSVENLEPIRDVLGTPLVSIWEA